MGDAWLALTDGRTAAARAATGAPNVVLVDLALDYAAAKRSPSRPPIGCGASALGAAAGVLQQAGAAVSPMDDVAGLAVMRTVAMLVNEAADAAMQGIATPPTSTSRCRTASTTRADRSRGATYRPARVAGVLANLAAHYGEDRYRISPRLARGAATAAASRA